MGAPGSYLGAGVRWHGHRPALKTPCEYLDGLDQCIYLVLKAADALLHRDTGRAPAWFCWSVHDYQLRRSLSPGSRAVGPGPGATRPFRLTPRQGLAGPAAISRPAYSMTASMIWPACALVLAAATSRAPSPINEVRTAA